MTIAIALGALAASAAQPQWPLDREIDLSSGFGDFRDGHFHSGIDLRTGGKVGSPVIAPVDGWVWRVKMSYYGYGKALYFMGDDGHVYVMGHLLRLAEPVDKRVKKEQIAAERYYRDVYFKKDEFRFPRGEILAYSGQSGGGGPHLHFEERTADGNLPLNPLTHSFALTDNVAPVIERVGFQLTDDSSLLDNARRKLYLPVTPASKAGEYRLDTVLYFHRPFGFLVDGYDMIRAGGMRQAVYRYTVYLDDQKWYETQFDTTDYEAGTLVRLEYDYSEAASDHARARRLYQVAGDTYRGSHAAEGDGVIGSGKSLAIGRHQVRIVATDASQNRASLSFAFLWGPPGDIYRLDAATKVGGDTTQFDFTAAPGCDRLGIDSVKVLLNRKEMWGPPSQVTVSRLESGQLRCRVVGQSIETAVLRLFVFADGAIIRDNLFNGLQDYVPERCTITPEVVDDGLLIHVEARVLRGARGHAYLYHDGRLLGIEPLQYFDMTELACFVPPRAKYEHIDSIGAVLSPDTTRPVMAFSDTLSIHLLGLRPQQDIEFDRWFSIRCKSDGFYAPRYIEIVRTQPNMIRLQLKSYHYEIRPDVFACRSDFEVRLRPLRTDFELSPCGICWLDRKENRWVWLDNSRQGDTLSAPSHGGGSYAVVTDVSPPVISLLTVHNGATYTDLTPRLAFQLQDTLSGIGDDRNINVKLNGKWMIPEYDPETYQCEVWLPGPLQPGMHHLAIVATDRAGLKAEQYLQFSIASKGKR